MGLFCCTALPIAFQPDATQYCNSAHACWLYAVRVLVCRHARLCIFLSIQHLTLSPWATAFACMQEYLNR